MKRSFLNWIGTCLCGIALVAALAGCGGPPDEGPDKPLTNTDKLIKGPPPGPPPHSMSPGGPNSGAPGTGLRLPASKGKH